MCSYVDVLGKHEFRLESAFILLKNLRVVGVASDKDCPFFALESSDDPGLGSHGDRRVVKKSDNEHAARYSNFSYDLISRSCPSNVMADCGRQAERSFLTERITKHKSSWSLI